jgi:transcriptional regulator with XRE-family HTH domain
MNKDSQIIFGENVRRLRKKIGWSQEQLAEACNLHRTYIGSIERGERNVSLRNIVKIALSLGVKPANLIGGV